MELESPPTLPKMKQMARRHGMAVKTAKRGLYWLVRPGVDGMDPGKLLSPRRGVTPEELWVLLTAPEGHPLIAQMFASPRDDKTSFEPDTAEAGGQEVVVVREVEALTPDADGKIPMDAFATPVAHTRAYTRDRAHARGDDA